MREMCDSGIGWLGEIPADWKVRKTKYLFDIHKRIAGKEGYDVLSVTQKGLRVKDIESGEGQLADDYSGYQLVYPGDFVMNHMDLLTGWVDCSDLHGVTSPDYRVFRPKRNMALDSRFYRFVFQYCYSGRVFYNLGNGVSGQGRWRLQTSAFNNFIVPFPPLSGQRRIAAYLDEQCAAIGETKKTIEDEIEVLRRLRKATIFQAVTKGLDDGASMRDSGIDWVPAIPVGWKAIPYKHVFKEIERPARADDEVITCFRDGEVTLRKNRREDGFTIAEQESGYQHISRGDLVVHGMDGFAGSIGISDSDGKATPVLIVLNPLHDECPRYFMYQLRAYAYLKVFLATSTGIRVRSCSLNWKKLGSLPAIVPPSNEQRRIADYLDERCDAIDSIIDARTRQLERLEDYRIALIYAYVTGKKEVSAS